MKIQLCAVVLFCYLCVPRSCFESIFGLSRFVRLNSLCFAYQVVFVLSCLSSCCVVYRVVIIRCSSSCFVMFVKCWSVHYLIKRMPIQCAVFNQVQSRFYAL